MIVAGHHDTVGDLVAETIARLTWVAHPIDVGRADPEKIT